jgi:hypothetical protein
MLIKITLTQSEFNEIKNEPSNYVNNIADLKCNIIDTIDKTLNLCGYNLDIEIIKV